MKKILMIGLGIVALTYLSLYFYFYSINVDRFKSTRLAQEYTFEFEEEFEELNFRTKNDGRINSVLFKSDSTQGVVCFWKRNGDVIAVRILIGWIKLRQSQS